MCPGVATALRRLPQEIFDQAPCACERRQRGYGCGNVAAEVSCGYGLNGGAVMQLKPRIEPRLCGDGAGSIDM